MSRLQQLLPRSAAAFHSSARLRGEVMEVAGPAFADSISEGDIRWVKAVGESVATDEVVAVIETDKTSMDVVAPAAGVVRSHLVEDGATVGPKQALYTLEAGAEGAAAPAAEAASPPPPPPEAATPAAAAPIPTSPPPVPPPPTQPLTSTPTASVPTTPLKAPAAQASGGPVSTTAVTGSRSETRVKMNRMRQRIAQRLKDAQNTYAMLTTFNEIDMSYAMALRKKHQEAFVKKHGFKLGFMSIFSKAAAAALQDQPVVNAVIDEEDIVYRHFVDISIAVATPKGLVVPVLRNVEGMNLAQIEGAINELGVKARDGKLAIEDMEGGTFTISNGGVFGSLMGTPIINPPQSSILGMHGIFDRPIAVDGKVEIRPMMYIALTYDHRLIDGREAVTFLRKVKAAVEDPAILLMDL